MTTIVRYDCGCVGTEPDANGTAAIIAACDNYDGGPGAIERNVKGKEYEPIDYRLELHDAFVAQQQYRQLRTALRVVMGSLP